MTGSLLVADEGEGDHLRHHQKQQQETPTDEIATSSSSTATATTTTKTGRRRQIRFAPPVLATAASEGHIEREHVCTPSNVTPRQLYLRKEDVEDEEEALEGLLAGSPNPPDHGLLLTLVPAQQSSSSSGEGTEEREGGGRAVATTGGGAGAGDELICQMTFVRDAHLFEIHPNAYGPAALDDVNVLYGGGSGAAVFHGIAPPAPSSSPAVATRSSSSNAGDNDDEHHAAPESRRHGEGCDDNVGRGSLDGHVVMKHGGEKELTEHFALATIEREIRLRASTRRAGYDDEEEDEQLFLLRQEAANAMTSRLPNFAFVYISPHHLRDRGAELWKAVRSVFTKWRVIKRMGYQWNRLSESNPARRQSCCTTKSGRQMRLFDNCQPSPRSNRGIAAVKPVEGGLPTVSSGVSLADATSGDNSEAASCQLGTLQSFDEAPDLDDSVPRVDVSNGYVDFHLGHTAKIACGAAAGVAADAAGDDRGSGEDDPSLRAGASVPRDAAHLVSQHRLHPQDPPPIMIQYGLPGDGYRNLSNLVTKLRHLQQERMWKFTCAQSEIGGCGLSQTAASLLVQRRLKDELLENLIREFVNVIRYLQRLTLEGEREAVSQVKEEFDGLLSLGIDTTVAQGSRQPGGRGGGGGGVLSASKVSKRADAFVGNAIRKNFHPKKGRFVRLRETGARFRSHFEASGKTNTMQIHDVGDHPPAAGVVAPNGDEITMTEVNKIRGSNGPELANGDGSKPRPTFVSEFMESGPLESDSGTNGGSDGRLGKADGSNGESTIRSSTSSSSASLDNPALILTTGECHPAYFLGLLLKEGASMSDVFALGKNATSTSSKSLTVLDQVSPHGWLRLLHHATTIVTCPTALTRIWTAGLTDAGLHNMFLDESQIWLFDLGEPNLQPVPAFLTKYLMSFFHTLGMEEVEDGSTWVKRFRVVTAGGGEGKRREGGGDDVVNSDIDRDGQFGGQRLALTDETSSILPDVYHAFNRTVDQLLHDLFCSDEDAVRDLLVRYVVLQVLSDAAFCLQRWEIKGGGRRDVGNHHCGLEKWLWRALWDLYIAWDVSVKMGPIDWDTDAVFAIDRRERGS